MKRPAGSPKPEIRSPKCGLARSGVWLLLLAASQVSGTPARCRIEATLDDHTGVITGVEQIPVTNPGDQWFHLYANAFRDSRTAYARELTATGDFEMGLASADRFGWTSIESLQSPGRSVRPTMHETELEVFLRPEPAPGETATLTVWFKTRVPALAAEMARKGRTFVLSHWYPEPAIISVGGYHLFGCSPTIFSDYDVTLTLASDMAVAASGSIADSALPGPVSSVQGPESSRTLRFTAANAAGFALVASPGLVEFQDSVAGTRISVFARCPANSNWLNALYRANDIVRRYSEWYGPCPCRHLSIVQADGVVSADASYPGLIVMATRPIPYTRVFEQALARQIALQWFSCALGPDESRHAWIAQGPAVYSEIRYMAEKYGPTNLLDNPILS
jgi:hypothetical protein